MNKILIALAVFTTISIVSAYEVTGSIVNIRVDRVASGSASNKIATIWVKRDDNGNIGKYWVHINRENPMLSFALTAYTTGKPVTLEYGSVIEWIRFKDE